MDSACPLVLNPASQLQPNDIVWSLCFPKETIKELETDFQPGKQKGQLKWLVGKLSFRKVNLDHEN